ncbi:ABC transporter ATP-binding protein [Arthrobacter castelli]|uniref:ABC transporter ATP-binding protein n=1 Tax=Arthrobacter castelli TaxID=271431 RepID=UPI000686F40A|nr:ABC transporter ATP-binding protein [Arthrobacter castelli]
MNALTSLSTQPTKRVREDGPIIGVEQLTKSYAKPKGGQFNAVDNVTFEVSAGETYAMLGPNGAGKSTTIEILEGHRKPTSGAARVLGCRPYKASPAFRARIGVVLQEATDAGELGVAESLRNLAVFYPNPRSVDEVVAAVGLEEKASARIKALSGGQRRRADVAMGLIGNPELLFLDEPTTGFDPEARRAFWELIRSLGQDGTTVVLTTHYLDEAQQLADRLGIIAGGRLIAEGTPTTIGGPEVRTPRVRWTDQEGRHEQITTEPASLIQRISDGGRREPELLEVFRPSLEDIYLQLLDHQKSVDPKPASEPRNRQDLP